MAKRYTKQQALRDGRRKYQDARGDWHNVKGGGYTSEPRWSARARAAEEPKPPKPPRGFEPVEPPPVAREDVDSARAYTKEVLQAAAEELRRQGYDARVATTITPAGEMDADIRVTNVEREPLAALNAIEEAIELQQKVAQHPLWVSIGTKLDVERTNRLRMQTEQATRAELEAEKRLYPVTRTGQFTVWTHAQRARNQGDQFQAARQSVIEKGLPGKGSGVVSSLSVRVHWNNQNEQPGQRRPS